MDQVFQSSGTKLQLSITLSRSYAETENSWNDIKKLVKQLQTTLFSNVVYILKRKSTEG